jgi:hypothetical protein
MGISPAAGRCLLLEDVLTTMENIVGDFIYV